MVTPSMITGLDCYNDSYWVEQGNGYIMGGVFNGCPIGIMPLWASQTHSYILKTICGANRMNPVHLTTIEIFRDRLAHIAGILNLNYNQLLATMVLFNYSVEKKVLEVRCLGDGRYFINGIEHRTYYPNSIDYIGNHIHDTVFIKYLGSCEHMVYEDVTSFTVCYDGVQSGSLQIV